MATSERQVSDPDDSRRKLIIIVAVVAAALIGGLFWLLLLTVGSNTSASTLEGAIRAGSPEFEQYASKIVLDEPEAYESKQALGGIVMNLRTIAHNFTGRTLTGLEVKGVVVDHQVKPVKQGTVVAIPSSRQVELENNRSMVVVVMLDGMTDKDDRANIKMEVTGFKLK